MINIGIDVHKRKCVATLKGATKQILEQTSFDNTTEQITKFANDVQQRYDSIRAVCESTANYWIRLHDTLEEHGIDTILVHPAKTRIIAQAKLKNDKLDSEVLADLLRSDMIYESFVPEKHYRELRNLVRTRLGLVRTCTTYKNKIHAILAKYEHNPSCNIFSKKGIIRLRGIDLSEIDRMTMNSYIDGMELLQKQIDTFESQIAAISKDDQRTRLLMTIPGINYVTALTVISEIVDISRFATPEKLVAYAGLAPSQRNSGDTKRAGKITKQGSSWLRYAMVEAANIAKQHDERIGKFYSRIASRRGPQKARVAAAKEMLVIIWHMLHNMEPYRTQDQELTERKYKRMEADSSSA
ncbi:MAG TPA: IS110 family transposase [Candidatus Nitrosotenuis sp.]|nr:IS110 family transposase [Candidatus Nitrosotenuis sp.]